MFLSFFLICWSAEGVPKEMSQLEGQGEEQGVGIGERGGGGGGGGKVRTRLPQGRAGLKLCPISGIVAKREGPAIDTLGDALVNSCEDGQSSGQKERGTNLKKLEALNKGVVFPVGRLGSWPAVGE